MARNPKSKRSTNVFATQRPLSSGNEKQLTFDLAAGSWKGSESLQNAPGRAASACARSFFLSLPIRTGSIAQSLEHWAASLYEPSDGEQES
jgi:hypothetical protein